MYLACWLLKKNHRVWYKKLGHASLRLISKLQKHNFVRGLPSISYKDDLLCKSCQKRKQIKTSFSSKNIVSTSRPLELLHLDMFGPTRTSSISGKRYGLVIVDDYSRRTWIMFLTHNDESFNVFFEFYKRFQNEGVCVTPQILVQNIAWKALVNSFYSWNTCQKIPLKHITTH